MLYTIAMDHLLIQATSIPCVLISKGHRHHEAKLDQPGPHGGPAVAQVFTEERTPQLHEWVANIRSCHKWDLDANLQVGSGLSLCE